MVDVSHRPNPTPSHEREEGDRMRPAKGAALAGVGHIRRRYGIGSRAAAISWLRLASASLIRSTVAS